MLNIIKNTIFLMIIILGFLLPNTLLSGNQPVALSYCIADLKFTGDEVKICELGPSTTSSFMGHDKIIKEQLPPFFSEIMKKIIHKT